MTVLVDDLVPAELLQAPAGAVGPRRGDGGSRPCCWPVRSSASAGANRPPRRHDVLGQRSFAERAPAARKVGGN
jgi:hypothetical protein